VEAHAEHKLILGMRGCAACGTSLLQRMQCLRYFVSATLRSCEELEARGFACHA